MGHAYLMGKMYQSLVKVDMGLEEWEDSTKVMARALWTSKCSCPVDRDCDNNQRVLQPNGYYSCVSFGDDKVYPINFTKEVSLKGPVERINKNLDYPMTENCMLGCELFKLCNGCLKTVKKLSGRRLD